MFQISISNSTQNIDELFEFINYDTFIEFFYKTLPVNDDNQYEVEFVIDESLITFDEYINFIEILFNEPFDNPDNCETVEELGQWLKAYRYLAIIDDHFS